jgi:hypothetical protein
MTPTLLGIIYIHEKVLKTEGKLMSLKMPINGPTLLGIIITY